MISAPPYVTNESVVTADQWQQLVDFIDEATWARPSTVVRLLVSQTPSTSWSATTEQSVGGDPYLYADSSCFYTQLAFGRIVSGQSDVSFGMPMSTITASMSGFRVTQKSSNTEPVEYFTGTVRTAAARTSAGSTFFLGRLAV